MQRLESANDCRVPLLMSEGYTSEQLEVQLGSPHWSELESLSACDFWAFEYPCGLNLVYVYMYDSGTAFVDANYQEPVHALRHVPLPRLWRIGDIEQRMIDVLAAEFPDLADNFQSEADYQVWRIDDNGNEFTVGEPTSERDAVCHMLELEAKQHKQTYWYARVEQGAT